MLYHLIKKSDLNTIDNINQSDRRIINIAFRHLNDDLLYINHLRLKSNTIHVNIKESDIQRIARNLNQPDGRVSSRFNFLQLIWEKIQNFLGLAITSEDLVNQRDQISSGLQKYKAELKSKSGVLQEREEELTLIEKDAPFLFFICAEIQDILTKIDDLFKEESANENKNESIRRFIEKILEEKNARLEQLKKEKTNFDDDHIMFVKLNILDPLEHMLNHNAHESKDVCQAFKRTFFKIFLSYYNKEAEITNNIEALNSRMKALKTKIDIYKHSKSLFKESIYGLQ